VTAQLRSILDDLASTTAGAASGRGLLEIPIDKISRDETQPREKFDPDRIAELAASIRKSGVIQPVLLFPDPNDPSAYKILAGERRVLAAQKAGLATVPAIVRDVDEPTRLILQLVENIQREDLRLLEKAKSFVRLERLTGKKPKELAAELGLSPATFSNTKRALDATGPAFDALNNDLITNAETLRLFSQLPEGKQEKLLKEAMASGLTISRPIVEKALGGSRPPTARPAEPPAATKPAGDPDPSIGADDPAAQGEARSSLARLTLSHWHALFAALGLPPSDDTEDMMSTLFQFLESRAAG
jgi:ParB family transcriptional regulator, chromosome partitioning protein